MNNFSECPRTNHFPKTCLQVERDEIQEQIEAVKRGHRHAM